MHRTENEVVLICEIIIIHSLNIFIHHPGLSGRLQAVALFPGQIIIRQALLTERLM